MPKPIIIEKRGPHAWTMTVHGNPVVNVKPEGPKPELSFKGRKNYVEGAPEYVFTTKSDADHVAHMFGRYVLGLGDFTYTYVEYRDHRVPVTVADEEARDYIAVDSHGKRVWGPGKDYAEAKRHADQTGGVVKFEMGEHSSAQDFPTQAAAIEHAYSQPDGDKLFIYYEAGKFHIAAPGEEPVHATPVNVFTRPGEAEARDDAPVIYEAGAEPAGKPWPAPETVAGKKRGRKKSAEASENAKPSEAPEASAPQQGDCLPWVRVTRDPERYEACLAEARRIGPIDNARKVYDLLAPTLAKEDQEVLMVVLVDVHRQLRGVAEVHRGQRSRVGVGVTDVMRVVIATGSEAFIVVHNHPSGSAKPSQADVDLTKTIEEAAKPYGKDLTFLDHVVIGSGQFASIKEGSKLYKVRRQ